MDEDGFIRQRRNVIVVSLILLFVQGTGIELTELNILGNKAPLANPLSLLPVLWIAWSYLTLRYWQAFNEYPNQKFKLALDERIRTEAVTYVVSQLKNAPLPSQLPEGVSPSHRSSVSLNEVRVSGWTTAIASLHHSFAVPIAGALPPVSQDSPWSLPKKTVFRIHVSALITILLSTSIFTELYLPFLIAVAPVYRPALSLTSWLAK